MNGIYESIVMKDMWHVLLAVKLETMAGESGCKNFTLETGKLWSWSMFLSTCSMSCFMKQWRDKYELFDGQWHEMCTLSICWHRVNALQMARVQNRFEVRRMGIQGDLKEFCFCLFNISDMRCWTLELRFSSVTQFRGMKLKLRK